MDLIYCDHAATTPVSKEVINEMLPYFCESYGNASSLYSLGRKNKRIIDLARNQVAKSINAKNKEIYFTSCGSESDNLAIKGFVKANKEKGRHIITTKIEHPAILNTCKSLEREGFEISYINVEKNGIINLSELQNAIRSDTILISVMFANNEIGTIQPIKDISKIAKETGIIFHTDAVQAIGNIKIDVEEFGIDMLSMSAHKFYGPKGMGALYVRDGIEFERIQDGGHQERNKRAGTENVAGIVGLGKAIEIANERIENYNSKLKKLRNYFISEIRISFPDAIINGDLENRLAGNVNVSFPHVDAEELLLKLDEKNICASAGSACSSGNPEPSHVLVALGLDERYYNGTLRFTFGESNNIEQVKYVINTLKEIVY